MCSPENFEWIAPLLLGGPMALLALLFLFADWKGWLG
jgi:hypothetical protein